MKAIKKDSFWLEILLFLSLASIGNLAINIADRKKVAALINNEDVAPIILIIKPATPGPLISPTEEMTCRFALAERRLSGGITIGNNEERDNSKIS